MLLSMLLHSKGGLLINHAETKVAAIIVNENLQSMLHMKRVESGKGVHCERPIERVLYGTSPFTTKLLDEKGTRYSNTHTGWQLHHKQPSVHKAISVRGTSRRRGSRQG